MWALHEVTWMAGLLDGEGSFYPSGPKKYPLISVKMSDRDTLEYFAELAGGYSVSEETYYRRSGWKPQWSVRVSGATARRLMAVIYPFMSMRRQQQIVDTLRAFVQRPDWPTCMSNMVKKKAAHVAWHVNRGVVNPNCPFCIGKEN